MNKPPELLTLALDTEIVAVSYVATHHATKMSADRSVLVLECPLSILGASHLQRDVAMRDAHAAFSFDAV